MPITYSKVLTIYYLNDSIKQCCLYFLGVQDFNGNFFWGLVMRYLHQFVHLMLTLRIASENRIPATILSLLCEKDFQEGGQTIAGEKFIESTRDCYLAYLPEQIEARSFELVSVSLERCHDRKGPPYLKLRSQYARHDFVGKLTDEFVKLRLALRQELEFVLEDAGYAITAYDNPYFLDGQAVDGARSLSINANAPEWLINIDGAPVMIWDRPKNEKGAQKIIRQTARMLEIDGDDAIEIVKV